MHEWRRVDHGSKRIAWNGPVGSGSCAAGTAATVQRRREAAYSRGSRRLYEAGELGALLRREGIYSSYLSRWRRARDRGQLDALAPGKRGRKLLSDAALAREVTKLRRDNERLQARLDQAEVIIEVQKKLSQLLGPSVREDRSNGRP